MSQKTLALLPEEKSSLLKPSIDPKYRTARKLVIGVCSREYQRKHFDILESLREIEGVEIRVTGGSVPESHMAQWFNDIDYMLVTSEIEGGPMSVLEAMAMHKPIIAPDVGWCWEYPVIRFTSDENLIDIVDRLANPVSTWEDKSHALAQICRRAIAAKAKSTQINFGDRYQQLISLIADHKPRTIIEVGTWNADRAVQMVQEALRWRPIVHYDGFDLFEEATQRTNDQEFNRKPTARMLEATAKLDRVKRAYPGFTYQLHKGNSRTTLTERAADFAFIDGGHSIETITHDMQALKSVPVVVMDDWYEPDENGRCPDVSRFGCNMVLNGDPKQILPIAGRVSGGGIVKMVLLNRR